MSDLSYALRDKLRIHNVNVKKGAGGVVCQNEGITVLSKTVAATTQVTLPPLPQLGDFAFVKDGNGDSGSHSITIVPDGVTATTIDGASSYVMSVNYAAVLLMYNGTEWNVVGGVNVPGTIARTLLSQETNPHVIPLTALRKVAVVSAGIPAADDGTSLGLVNGTYLTSNPVAETGDLKTLTTTRTARFQFPVPLEYVAGQAITLVLNAGMVTTVADTTATVNINCVRVAAPTVDIGTTTGATTINSLTPANVTFTITPTSVVAGDVLDVVITVAVHDAASGTAVIAAINKITLNLATKG